MNFFNSTKKFGSVKKAMRIIPYINWSDSTIRNMLYDTKAELSNKIMEMVIAIFLLSTIGVVAIQTLLNGTPAGMTAQQTTMWQTVITLIFVALVLVFVFYAMKRGKK